jgi:cell division protein FtsB
MREGNSVFNKIKGLVRDTKGIVFTLVILAVVVYFFFAAVSGASDKADASSAATLEKAVKRAAVQCYAIEGFFPPEVTYLADNYGIILDPRYIVEYNAFSGNNLPNIKVLY